MARLGRSNIYIQCTLVDALPNEWWFRGAFQNVFAKPSAKPSLMWAPPAKPSAKLSAKKRSIATMRCHDAKAHALGGRTKEHLPYASE